MANSATGVRNVVNNTKYKEIPSKPTLKWQKLKLSKLYTNWYWLTLESKMIHTYILNKKFKIAKLKPIIWRFLVLL